MIFCNAQKCLFGRQRISSSQGEKNWHNNCWCYVQGPPPPRNRGSVCGEFLLTSRAQFYSGYSRMVLCWAQTQELLKAPLFVIRTVKRSTTSLQTFTAAVQVPVQIQKTQQVHSFLLCSLFLLEGSCKLTLSFTSCGFLSLSLSLSSLLTLAQLL